MINLYTPFYLCADVVRVGSMRFDVLEPPQTYVKILYTLLFVISFTIAGSRWAFEIFCEVVGFDIISDFGMIHHLTILGIDLMHCPKLCLSLQQTNTYAYI